MSGNDFDFSYNTNDEFGGGQDGKGLRALLEKTLEENKKLVERLERQEREAKIDRLFREKGLDPKVAELMGDADPEEWLGKYGDLFVGGSSQPEAAPSEPPAQETRQAGDQANSVSVEEDSDLRAEREAYEAAMSLTNTMGHPARGSLEMIEKINSFDNPDDLIKFMQDNS